MQMHCVYCGARIPVTTILYSDAPTAEQEARAKFEDEHDRTCGPRSVAIIADLLRADRPPSKEH